MVVRDLISDCFLPVTASDSVGDALSQVIASEFSRLPVVDDDGLLVGMIRLAVLLKETDLTQSVAALPFDPPVSVSADAHLYDAIQMVVDREVELLPVTDGAGRYLGSVGLSDILVPVSKMLAVSASGSVLQITVPRRDYTLRDIVHSIEQTGGLVLSLCSEQGATDDDYVLTVKTSVDDTSRIRAVLEHMGYRVTSATRQAEVDHELQHRVAEFMHYLDV